MKLPKKKHGALIICCAVSIILLVVFAISQTKAPSVAQQPQAVVKPITKPAQPYSPSQPIARQLDEYENRLLDRAETYYNRRMTILLWVMGVIMVAGGTVIGVVVPYILEKRRNEEFKELTAKIEKQEADLQKQIAEEIAKTLSKTEDKLKTGLISLNEDVTKAVSSNFSMLYAAIGGLLSTQVAQAGAGYALMLQAHVLAMKYSIISQRPGGCLTASQIIDVFSQPGIANKLTLETLKAVNGEIENMKGNLDKIIDDKKRVDMESQVEELQIYVCALIHEKQQTTPPQAGS